MNHDYSVDPYFPVKHVMCPYGGWCRTCMQIIVETQSFGISSDYPGLSRGYHGGNNYCVNHEGNRAIDKVKDAERDAKFATKYAAAVAERIEALAAEGKK